MKGLKMPVYFLKMFFLIMIKQKSFCPPGYYLDYFESLNLYLLLRDSFSVIDLG